MGETKIKGQGLALYPLSHNLVKNYPSLELADGAQPEWFTAASATVTEEDATGEGLSDSPNERVIKCVTTAINGGVRQSFSPSDERLLTASQTQISFGVWVRLVTAGTLTVQLVDDGVPTQLGSIATTTTTGSFVYLEITDATLLSNNLEIRIYHSVNAATFYIANPMLNTGTAVAPWKPRGLVYRNKFVDDIVSTDPAVTTWTDLDLSTNTSENTVAVQLVTAISDIGTAGRSLWGRRKGSSAAQDDSTVIGFSPGGNLNIMTADFVLCDDGQTIQWSVGNSDVDIVRISLKGYWEWE